MADGGDLEINPTSTYVIDPANNNSDYWFELAVQSGDHAFSRTVTARPEDPAAPTSQDYSPIPNSGSQIVFLNGTAVSAGTTQVWFNNGTEFGGWSQALPSNVISTDQFTVASDAVYFVVEFRSFNQQTPPREIWRTDGTAAGTRKVVSHPSGTTSFPFAPEFQNLEASGELVLFKANSRLYVIDENETSNYREVEGLTVGSGGSGTMLSIDGGILLSGYLDGDAAEDARLLKIEPDLSIIEVHGSYDYEPAIGNLQERNGNVFFTASHAAGGQTVWRLVLGEGGALGNVEALFAPLADAETDGGFRGIVQPIITADEHVYFYTRPWIATDGEFSSDWRLAYSNGTDTKLIWDETLLGPNVPNSSIAQQSKVTAPLGNDLVLLAANNSASPENFWSKVWVVYDAAEDSFAQVSVNGEPRFGERPSTQQEYLLVEEKASGTWLVDGYSGNTASDSKPYNLIHLSVDGTNDFVLDTGSRIFGSDGERLWFQGGRVLAGE